MNVNEYNNLLNKYIKLLFEKNCLTEELIQIRRRKFL